MRGFFLKNLPVIELFILVSRPVEHFLKVIFLNTQSKASTAIFLCVAENIPKIPKTIKAMKQIILLE